MYIGTGRVRPSRFPLGVRSMVDVVAVLVLANSGPVEA